VSLRGSRARRVGGAPAPRVARVLAIGLFGLGLSACALTRPPLRGPAPPVAGHLDRVRALADWSLAGRIGVRAGRDAWSGSVRWTQLGARFRIRFVGPLGQGAFDLRGAPGAVVLRTSRGGPYRAATAGILMERVLGRRLPVAALAYWVRGVPRPGAPYRLTLGGDGRIRGFTQSGWTLTVRDYRRVGRVELPGFVDARRPGLRVRLMVSNWSLAPSAAALSD